MSAGESVVFVLPDKMGGLLNIVANLLEYRVPDAFTYHAVLTHNPLQGDTVFGRPLRVDTQRTVEMRMPVENIYAVLRRLHAALPTGEGVLVANELPELAMLHACPVPRGVAYILHGDHDYYYDLARRHESVVDVFVAYSRAMHERLREMLPGRHADIRYLPYGVPIPPAARTAAPGPLRVIFAGRLEHGQKGVFDLPPIDDVLRSQGVDVRWTIAGDGPDRAALGERWRGEHVRWLGALSNADVIAAELEHDVFVLPTRAEGFPVALVEAMACGLVPVVSDIASGVPEVVDEGVNGFRPAVGDIPGFAAAIAALDADRARLDAMSRAARAKVAAAFDIRPRAADYQRLFADWRAWRRPRPRAALPYRSRLDQPWLPNPLVRAVRTTVRWAQGRPF